MTIYDAISQTFFNAAKYKLIPIFRSIIRFGLLPLKLLPVTSEQFGPPAGYAKRTADWVNRTQHQNVQYIEINKPEHIRNPPPVCLDAKPHWKFSKAYDYDYPATFVAEIPLGRAVGNYATIIAPDDILLTDLSIHFGTAPKDHPILCSPKLPSCSYIDSSVGVLAAQGQENYYHWMYDIIPRLELLKLSQSMAEQFIVNADQPFQRESLLIMGIKDNQIIQCSKQLHVKAKTLIVPSSTGHCAKWVYDFLRSTFMPLAAKKELNASRRIYISRATNKRRRVINENEVIEMLKARGFQVVTCDGLTVKEQVSLFAELEAVVSPHGAALSNIAFCSPGTKIFELFTPSYVNPCYWAISAQAELSYYYLLGKGRRPKEFYDPHHLFSDIVVDIDELSQLLDVADIR